MLIVRCSSISSSNSVVSYSARTNTKRAISISFILIAHHRMVKMLSLYGLLLTSPKTVHCCPTSLGHVVLMSCIALSHIFHKITIKHCLSHLLLIILLHSIVLLSISPESSNSCLVENLLFLIHLIHIWQHFVDS